MTHIVSPNRPVRIPTPALMVFFGLTFAITWGLIGLYVFQPEWASQTFGAISGSHPIFFLATWAPAIAALTLALCAAKPAPQERLSRPVVRFPVRRRKFPMPNQVIGGSQNSAFHW